MLFGKLYGMDTPYSLSLTPPEYAYVAVSSAGVKIQDEREERRKERKKPRQK